jgi:PAS domain-containing protein
LNEARSLSVEAAVKTAADGLDFQSINSYETGSQAIEASFKLHDTISPALDNLLQVRLNRLTRKKYFVEIFALAVVAIAIYAFIAFGLNLKKRKQAEKALRQAEAKFRSIFENATEGIFQTAPDGKFISANPALIRLYGYASLEELNAHLTYSPA